MVYKLLLEKSEIHTSKELDSLEIRYALALADGVHIDSLPGSDSTRRRALRGLRRKGAIEEVPDAQVLVDATPASQWLSSAPNALDINDGLVVFETFTAKEIQEMGHDGRFQNFCRLFGAEPKHQKVRKAWARVENEFYKCDPDHIPEIVQIAPAIFKAAQHHSRWQALRLVDQETPGDWLDKGKYNLPIYGGRAGTEPPPPETDDYWQTRINTAVQKLHERDIEFVSPQGQERLKQACRRLEAKLRMESLPQGY